MPTRDTIASCLHEWSWRWQGRLHYAVARRRAPTMLRGAPIARNLAMEPHGSGGGTYHVCPAGLGPESVVYSFGIGCDTSFERSLIARYGLDVHAFDPTDESARYLEEHPQPAGFRFRQCGLAASDGTLPLRSLKRGNPHYRPATILDTRASDHPVVEIEVRSLRSLMQEHGHAQLDILKMDVEGAEYEVLESLVEGGIPTRQLVLEFHPHLVNLSGSRSMFGRRGWTRTESALEEICRNGFEISHVSERGTELSFIK